MPGNSISQDRLNWLKQRVESMQLEIEQLTMMTERRRAALGALRAALDYCGYDLSAIMGTKCRERSVVDIRSIAWAVYKAETGYSCQQLAQDFNWDRTTIYCSVRRANDLRRYDRNFSDMFDSVQGAFINALSAEQEKAKKGDSNNS